MESSFNEEKAFDELRKGYGKAEETLRNEDKLEDFLQQLEKKLKKIPKLGDTLAMIPVLISLLKSYIKKEYTTVPVGSVIAIISALAYFLSPIDLIPDSIPVLGYIDDAAVIAACLKLVKSDVDEYVVWREEKKNTIDV